MAGSHDETTTGVHSSPSAGKPADHLPGRVGPDREPPRYTLAWMTHDYKHHRTRGKVHFLASAPPANTILGAGLPGDSPPSPMTASTLIAAIAGLERAVRDHALDAATDQTR